MPGAGRLGDLSQVPADSHGCPACPHPAVGPAIGGSPDVNVNGRSALRVDDPGVHAACCGSNTWVAYLGSITVYINGMPAHRLGDEATHCGGTGTLVTASSDVFIGGGKTHVGRKAPCIKCMIEAAQRGAALLDVGSGMDGFA